MVKHYTKVGWSLETRQKAAKTRTLRKRIRKELADAYEKEYGKPYHP